MTLTKPQRVELEAIRDGYTQTTNSRVRLKLVAMGLLASDHTLTQSAWYALTAEPPPTETEFTSRLLLYLGARCPVTAAQGYRVWRQNSGEVVVRGRSGRSDGVFRAGPPPGAADISGVVWPEGWRIELETKGVRTPTSEAQLTWEARMQSYGAVYVRYRYDGLVSVAENLERAAVTLENKIEERRDRAARESLLSRPASRNPTEIEVEVAKRAVGAICGVIGGVT